MAHSSKNQHLTTSRGAALYIGALLGPGLLLLPGLAAAEAGPASILAWLALLILSGLFAAVFSALGRHNPSAGGVIGYVTAGLGARARAWPPAGCSWPGWCAAPRSSASSAPATSPT
jgi:amino acid transporter